jgi:hypothetical protein
LWHMDPWVGNESKTNDETTVNGMQQLRKYRRVLEKSLLGSCPREIIGVLLKAVFSMWPAPKIYHSTDRVEVDSAVQCRGAG